MKNVFKNVTKIKTRFYCIYCMNNGHEIIIRPEWVFIEADIYFDFKNKL